MTRFASKLLLVILTAATVFPALTGCGMGQARPRLDIPRLVQLYQSWRLKLDELLDQRFALDQIDAAIASALTGKTLRNIVVF